MPGITAFATSIPRYRLPRAVMAEAWGTHPLPGERSVANFDEDALTLAVAASLGALGEDGGRGLDGAFFVSTTPPYREKLVAATLATVLDAPASARTLDFGDSLRAASGAVFTAFDLVASGACRRVLVAAGEVRPAAPDTMDEQGAGDAGAAVLVSDQEGGLELLARRAHSEELYGTWRTDGAPYPRSFPGGLDARHGSGRVVPEVIAALLAEAGVAAGEVSRAVLCGNPRAVAAAARRAGLAPECVQDTLWAVVGETGAAQPLLLLAAALERAEPGELVLWVASGDGADAALFRVGERVPALRPALGLEQQIEVKRPLRAYGKYARFRGLVKRDYPSLDSSSAATLHRDRQEMLPLYGGRCPKCDVTQFPLDRLCVQCGHAGGLEPVRLPRRGRVFSFYANHVVPHADPPRVEAVVDLDGGARFFGHVTDADAADVAIDQPVELVFRRYHDAGGIHNYFWKVRPIQPGRTRAAAGRAEKEGA